HRMFLMSGEGKYMDVFERTLYNGFPSGVSLSGDRFFYPNPLEYDGKAVNNHGHAGRAPWFGCACCPPNILRTMAALTGYFYAVRGDEVFVNLYAQSDATATVKGVPVKLSQQTEYPWNGTVKLTVSSEKPATFTLRVRIPGWVQGRPLPSDLYHYDNAVPADWSVSVNGQKVLAQPEQGYLAISREWQGGEVVTLDLPMSVRRVSGHEKIAATQGRVALERGPVVYCLEGVDNTDAVFDCVLPETATISPVAKKELLGGITVLSVVGAQRAERTAEDKIVTHPAALTAIPYALWNNRGLAPMQVWVARTPERARLKPLPTLSSESKVSVSFHRREIDPAAIHDQLMPLNATDGFAPNFNWWPHKGSTEWAQLEFKQPAKVSEATVFWFDDTGSGECRVPASWRLLYRDGDGSWKPVEGASAYGTEKGKPNRVSFSAVTTGALRLETQLPERFSTGIWEWSVK
ncbi:MAG TPA: beta-L-arabinofuranosidase domain-containing protein, partial [Candidatus Sulfotelmatobacter sp.]|nr:beta-L-arabinofuranosidase domain-containing protein [Candidatus Sulfotelmatobacter sp.]